ncbi:unnamed protein product [Ectocarpus sp. CCAP 1310/34]|nr:unnamed protein product [Ectocarpus sp. CCAP 1310/34]
MFVLTAAAVVLAPLLLNLGSCYRAVLNDARIISLDPALQSKLEVLYAYPGFWALFWYRLSHALLMRNIPGLSSVVPRLVMSFVRYATSIDIHPAAQISREGVLIDHGAALVIGATAIIGARVTLYHGVTLGNSGKKVSPGGKRHPTIGDRVVLGAGAKILGDITVEDDVLVGANSVVTKSVPKHHTAVGVPARILCHGTCSGKNVTGAAICELHKRLNKVEKGSDAVVGPQRREDADVAGGQHVDKSQQQQQQQRGPQGDVEGTEASSLAWPVSDVTIIPSPSSENNHQQQKETFDAPVPSSLPSTLESGIRQILYSRNILEEIAVN